ncbi:MAG: DUF4835 family protein [Bacteroidales bacterium]|nr:DUF4835 family protein [Bacteroidales bacterium]
MMKRLFIILMAGILAVNIQAQELNTQIAVSSRQVEGTEREIYNTLQTALYEFLNNKKWSSYDFKIEERLECTMLVNITDRVSSDVFKGTVNLVSRRPIYRSSYNSVMINYIDKDLQFNYVEGEPVEFIESAFTSNLTGTLAYYTYIFLGLDFDSYTKFGGTPFYEKAQNIVSMAQNSQYNGWKSFESQKNRYWLVENLLNNSYAPIREFLYVYHRQGLDIMAEDVERGRASITESLEFLRRSYRDKPGSFLMQLVMDAKREELINIYIGAPDTEKVKAVNLLKEIDPGNSTKYQRILDSK